MLNIIVNSLIIGFMSAPMFVATAVWLRAMVFGDTIGVV